MNNEITVHCHTNLDGYSRESWVQSMAVKPAVGEYVASFNGSRLKIVSITHKQKDENEGHRPYLDIELHK